MRRGKRILAVVLTLVMVLAMGMNVFAAGGTASLTVKVNEKNTLEGQTLSVYKLFDVTKSGTSPDENYAYTVNDTYKSILAKVLKLSDTATNEDFYSAIQTIEAAAVQQFADDFTAEALKDSNVTATKTSEKIAKGVSTYEFEGLDYGYYLVYQTGTQKLQSSLVTVAALSVEVDLKGTAPSITKTADKTSVNIGDIVTYTITTTIPDPVGAANYTFKIHDTLTSGLDFVEDSQGTVPTTKKYNVSVTVSGTPNVTEIKEADLAADNDRKMTLDLSSYVITPSNVGKTLTVTYYAKVNSDAVVATNNSAALEYGNSPDSTTTTTPVTVDTPTYPININKTIKGAGTMLGGATFRLYTTEEAAKTAGNDALKVTAVTDTSGKYTFAGNSTTEINMDMVTSKTEIGQGYNLSINGLEEGNYWLVETKAPDGYHKLTAPIKVTITKGNSTNWTIAKNGTDEADKIIDIENSSGTLLPATGGMGTIIFTVAALILIAGVAVSFVISRRKKD